MTTQDERYAEAISTKRCPICERPRMAHDDGCPWEQRVWAQQERFHFAVRELAEVMIAEAERAGRTIAAALNRARRNH